MSEGQIQDDLLTELENRTSRLDWTYRLDMLLSVQEDTEALEGE